MTMNWLDIVLLVILAISVFGGLKNGLIKGVLGLAGIIVGVVLSGIYYVNLAESLTFIPHVDDIQHVVTIDHHGLDQPLLPVAPRLLEGTGPPILARRTRHERALGRQQPLLVAARMGATEIRDVVVDRPTQVGLEPA